MKAKGKNEFEKNYFNRRQRGCLPNQATWELQLQPQKPCYFWASASILQQPGPTDQLTLETVKD